MTFIKDFDSYVVDGDSISCEVDGFCVLATLHHDPDSTPASKVEDNYTPETLMAWERDEWHFFGVAVTVWRDGVRLTGLYEHALWGIEGNFPGGHNNYFREVANDLLPQALADAKARIAKWHQETAPTTTE